MKYSYKFASVLTLLALLALTFVTPAAAFEERSGDDVVIGADEVIDDDLYVFAESFTLDGTVNGDLVVFGRTVTINGTVNGDLAAGAQVVVINGIVSDDARIGAAAIQLGENARIGSDLLVGGASLETKTGSLVEGEVVVGSGQTLLAGDVTGDVTAGTGGLELRGSFGGDVNAYVEATEESQDSPPINMYMSQIPISLPTVRPGLTVDEGALIAGNLVYSSTLDLPIPAAAVGGSVTRVEPQVEEGVPAREPTAGEIVGKWALDLLRVSVTLILVGLLLGWLFPRFMNALPGKLASQPLPSLGWGAVAYAAAVFTMLAVLVVWILGMVVSGLLTLGSLTGFVFWTGLVVLIALVVGFCLAILYLTYIVVGQAVGKWILGRTNPALADHKLWPLVIGVVVVVFVVGLLKFPLVPLLGILGWLVNFVIVLCGLGALWLYGREAWLARKTV
jgi:cytoskeletal protein CcmA (bactofilin family)